MNLAVKSIALLVLAAGTAVLLLNLMPWINAYHAGDLNSQQIMLGVGLLLANSIALIALFWSPARKNDYYARRAAAVKARKTTALAGNFEQLQD